MHRVLWAILVVSISALSTSAQGQANPASTQPHTILLDVGFMEVTFTKTEEFERISRDRDRLNAMIAEGKVRPVASLQLRTRSGEPGSARVGQRVPIQTSSLPARMVGNRQDTTAAVETVAVPQISYENTGFNLDATPTLGSDDHIDIRLKIEMTGLDRNSGALNPTFVQRTFSDVVRVKRDEAVVLLGMIQHEPLWPSMAPGSSGSPSPTRGSFIIVLAAKVLD